MANNILSAANIGPYNPTFFAQEALAILYKNLGFAQRVFLGFDRERSTMGRNMGEFVSMKRPGTFTAASHQPGVGTTVQDLNTSIVQLQLNNHYEVKFALTDRELSISGEQIIADHITPAAAALAENIDNQILNMCISAASSTYSPIGSRYAITGTPVDSSYITGPRKVLRENAAPMDNNLFYMIDTTVEAAFLDADFFNQYQVTGPGQNTDALLNGSLGRRFGVEVFSGQNYDVTNSQLATTGLTLIPSTAILSAQTISPVGSTTVTISAVATTLTSTTHQIALGTAFRYSNDPFVYTVTAQQTLVSATPTASIQITPALRRTVPTGTGITLMSRYAADPVELGAGSYISNLMFHRNAVGLVFGSLPSLGDGRGALVETITDPLTGVSLRARLYYNGDYATNFVALDVLYGIQILDPMLACRVVRPSSVLGN